MRVILLYVVAASYEIGLHVDVDFQSKRNRIRSKLEDRGVISKRFIAK